jgi:hypothetical protein
MMEVFVEYINTLLKLKAGARGILAELKPPTMKIDTFGISSRAKASDWIKSL